MDDETMNMMKDKIKSAWEITDLGKPSTIIGIEISQMQNSITISQQWHIKFILEWEGMTCSNPVATLLDLNIKILQIQMEMKVTIATAMHNLSENCNFLPMQWDPTSPTLLTA